MHGHRQGWVLCLIALALCGHAAAAEIVLERSAVDKLLAQTVFTNNGRYDLVKGPCSAYLDRPSVAIEGGRIRIRSHLSARVGVVDGKSCVGVAIASWTLASGRPVARGGSVVLTDLRIDQVDDPNLRLLVESGLLAALPRAIELDVRQAVRGMLQGNSGQFQAEVDTLAIDSVVAADDRLSVRFDFRLVAK
jgi:hypothetical protein